MTDSPESYVPLNERPIVEIVNTLQSSLGQKILAFGLHEKHPKVIGRLARAEQDPTDDQENRLRELATIAEILRNKGVVRSAFKAWMMGKNPYLEGIAPIEVFHEQGLDPVAEAAENLFMPPRA